MLTADEIIDALAGLTGPDRNKIRAVLKLMAPGDAEATGGQRSEPETLWNAVREMVGTHLPSYPRMRKHRNAKQVREGGEMTAAFITRYMPKLTHTERIAVTRQMVLCLLIRMERVEMPITPGTLACALPGLPEAVDDQFPGYAQAGRLHWALSMISKESE